MSTNLLEHLGKDTLPNAVIQQFVNWCAWEQAKPALVRILSKAGLADFANQIDESQDLDQLKAISKKAGDYAHEARKRTGPFGMSTAEASAFLVHKLAQAAQESDWDPEGVSFFAIQVSGWAGFAETEFRDFQQKIAGEADARKTQEHQLAQLFMGHQNSNP